MKLKRILTGTLAAIVAVTTVTVTSMITASAVGDLVFQGSGSTKYALKLTASAGIAQTKFTSSDKIDLVNNDMRTSGTLSLNGNGTNYNAKISEAKLNEASLTSTSVAFGLQLRENQLTTGDISNFKWSATAELIGNEGKHPVNDLRIDLSKIVIPNLQLTLRLNGQADQTINLYNLQAEVVTTNDSAAINSGSILDSRTLNQGNGMKRAEKEALKASDKIIVTAKLANPLSAQTVFTLQTDISGTNVNTVVGNKGDVYITFIPPTTFFYGNFPATEYTEAGERWFSTMQISNGINAGFNSVTITYSGQGATGTTGTTPPPVTNPPVTNPPVTEKPDSGNQPGTATEDAFTISNETLSTNIGGSYRLVTNGTGVKWATSNSKVCKMYTNGTIKGVAEGTATITATNSNGDKARCVVKVVSSTTPATSCKQTVTRGTVYTGKNYTLKAKLSAGSTDTITWSTNNPYIATVSSTGRVTTKNPGLVIITATSSSGKSSDATLTVKVPTVRLTKNTASVGVGKTTAISYATAPKAAATFESLDESVATVSSKGVITGKSSGTAEILVSANNVIKVFTVTVG